MFDRSKLLGMIDQSDQEEASAMIDELFLETNEIMIAVDMFAVQMKLRMLEKLQQGFWGWHDETDAEREHEFMEAMYDRANDVRHGKIEDRPKAYVDLANFIMMLARLERTKDVNARLNDVKPFPPLYR